MAIVLVIALAAGFVAVSGSLAAVTIFVVLRLTTRGPDTAMITMCQDLVNRVVAERQYGAMRADMKSVVPPPGAMGSDQMVDREPAADQAELTGEF